MARARARGATTSKQPVPRSQQLSWYPREYMICRVLLGGHHVPKEEPRIYPRAGGGYESEFDCMFCGATCVRVRDHHGFPLPGRIKYQPGYTMEEGGTMTSSEKASLFLLLASGMGDKR